MKTGHIVASMTAIALSLAATAFAQGSPEKLTIPLSDPNRPMTLKVGLISGGIHVKGHSGKDVIVEADIPAAEGDEEKQKKAGTLKKIQNTSMGLTAEEENNTVTVSTGLRGHSGGVDLTILVPSACSMELSTVNEGDIVVENVTGDLEVNNTNGSVTLKQISGSAVVQTVNGEVLVVFSKVTPDKAMSFSALNGDIDVTFPASLKATIQLKSDMGEIFSDFDMQMQKNPAQVEKNEKGKGKYRVTVEKTMRGTVGGGGQDIRFTNFNGDIFIRKGA